MANGASPIHIKAWGDSYKTVTATVQSQDFGLAPNSDDVGILTRIHAGSASALTAKLQQNLGGTWVDLTGATGNTVLDSNAAASAEINFASKANSGVLRVNISAVTLFSVKVVASADIANATDTWTSVGHGYVDGVEVVLTTSDTVPAGLTAGSTYFIRRVTDDTFKLCSTYANAIAGTVINITSDGVGNQTLTPAALVVDARIVYGRK